MREAHAWWPCAAGCDPCCRSLPRLPEISEGEWERVREALDALPEHVRDEIVARMVPAPAPVICPMLERASGTCLVYEARPIACRTYGFYVERDAGLHCAKVTDAVAANANDAVVWGNGEAVARELDALREPRSIAEWLV